MTRYNRDELARLAESLQAIALDLAASKHDPFTGATRAEVDDLEHAAAFLKETVGVLDKQRKNQQRRAAETAIAKKATRRKAQNRKRRSR